MGSRPPSLAGRAILALLLMVGFYLLALGIALLLLSLPYAEITYANRLDRLGLFGIIGGLLILWGIVPRPDVRSRRGTRCVDSISLGDLDHIHGILGAVPHVAVRIDLGGALQGRQPFR